MRLKRNALGIRLWLALVAAAAFLLAGCADSLNEDSGDSDTMRVELQPLLQQIGASRADGTRDISQVETNSQSFVDTLLVGAVVVRSRDTPWDLDEGISADDEEDLEDDVLNSANFFAIVDLPTSADTLEFRLPPQSAGDWQVMAAGLRVDIDVLGDLDGEDDAFIYYGFSDSFITRDQASAETVTVSMRRACLADTPPKGCAQFETDGQAVVTSTVEIQDILVNGSSIASHFNSQTGFSFPYSVTTSTSVSSVETALRTALVNGGGAAGNTVQVVTTHSDSPTYSTECGSFSYGGTGDLGNSCVQVYTTLLRETPTL